MSWTCHGYSNSDMVEKLRSAQAEAKVESFPYFCRTFKYKKLIDAGIITTSEVEDAMKGVDRAVFVPDKQISRLLRTMIILPCTTTGNAHQPCHKGGQILQCTPTLTVE
jgi:hypothetical protein